MPVILTVPHSLQVQPESVEVSGQVSLHSSKVYPGQVKSSIPRFPRLVNPKAHCHIVRNQKIKGAILRQWRARKTRS